MVTASIPVALASIAAASDAARYLGIPRQTFHRWARGYDRGGALLHVLETERPREARVTLIALAEAWVLWALRDAGVRTQRIRPALNRLQKEFGREYVLVAPERLPTASTCSGSSREHRKAPV